eukprot:s211_g4.t1
MEEAREAYRKWLGATPLERLGIQGIPSSYLQGERFLRLESRALAMLSKAVPQAIYDNALSIRNTTCVGLIFLVLKAFQPGGLHERTELLRGLTSLGETPTALQGVTALQYWFRHLERARSMGVAVPDCTLLLDALDGMVKPMLEKNPALLFRLNTTRMALQLDTVPTLPSVEQFARALLAELEVLAVSAPEGTAKKQRVAALAGADAGSGKGSTKPSAAAQSQDQGKKGLGKSKTPCTGWVTDAGCRFGKNCSFSHEAPRPQKCWVCGGAHQKADCTMPGGGKCPAPEAKQKAKGQPAAPPTKDKGKPHQKPSEVKPETGGKGSQETTAAIKEATKLLQSMRMAKVGVHLDAAIQINDLSHKGRCCGLIDGGATACLRTAKSHELQLPTLDVELAFGKCKLHVNQAGTLLSPTPVNPIVSVAALLELGFKVDWSRESCAITHPARSALRVDASSGCPEVPVSTALQLITEYEELVKKRDVREARIRCILRDMRDDTQAQLAGAPVTGGVEAEAALRLLLGRLFSDVASTVWDEVIPVITDEHCTRGWNRRIRRRVERSNGVLVHMGEKGSKRQLQSAADRCGQVLLHVDVYNRGLIVATFAYLLELAQRGLIKGVVGSLPYRSFSVYNYVADCINEEQGKGPVRLPGVSIGNRDGMLLSGPEAAARHHDDIMFLRMLTLQTVALEVARFRKDASPAVIIEQPEQQNGGPSFWTTPEWCSFRDRYKMVELGFDQGPLLHKTRRPTTVGTNLTPAAVLVDCRGPGLEAIGDPMLSRQGEEAWSSWAPGLIAAVTDMLVHRNKAGSCGYPAVAVRAMDAAFVQHIKQGHVPFRRDCRFCVRGGGKRRQHKRVLCPEGWSLSVDTAGPYKRAPDESGKKARYMITGVLTVPVLELKEGEGEEGELVEPEVECHAGGALSDEEIFAEGEDEKDPELSAKDVGEAKANRGLWEDLVKRDQEAWKAEAEQEMVVDVESEALNLAAEHRFRSQIVEAQDLEDEERCLKRDEAAGELARLCALEVQIARCDSVARTMILETGSTTVQGQDKCAALRSLSAGGTNLAADDTTPTGESVDPHPLPSDEYLQTRLVSAEEVKRNLSEWIPPMKDEYVSLVQTTGTCHPLDQEEFDAITQDPTSTVEVLPGKLVFSVKARSGKKKARIVGCGNHQRGPSRDKTDKHASGISAEVIRVLIRYAALRQWEIATTDVRTAFLNAPLVTPNQEILIVRVPNILRVANVCTERYWRLQRALYGLDVSPKSWVLYRNQTLREITSLTDGTPVTCFPIPEDANVWEVRRCKDGETLAYIGIYVDDLAVVTSANLLETIVETVRKPWKTSEPEIVNEESDVSFAGYEIRKCGNNFLVHQKSYLKEMMKQWEIEETSAVPSVKDPTRSTDCDVNVHELTKRAQAMAGQLLWAMAGQLLWVSTHSRPDVSFAVQSMCQKISTDPAAACDAGLVIMRYLRGTLGYALEYGKAPYTCGLWGELQFRRDERLVEVFSDASFCADEGSRSYQCALLYWAGSLVMWSGGRQSLIAASTAEAELIGMVEGYHVGRAFLPTIEALCSSLDRSDNKGEESIPLVKVMYGDNAAAIQLCQLDAGAWRTRHLRLRGAILRQAIEDLGWRVAHLPGVYMPADIGTKTLGPARFADLVPLLGFSGVVQNSQDTSGRKPQVAQAVVIRLLLAVILASKVTGGEAKEISNAQQELGSLAWVFVASFCIGSLEEGMQQPLLGSQQLEFSVSAANAGEEQVITGSQENQLCYEDFIDNAARRDETPGSAAFQYQPTYEDLLAAYPYALTGCERLRQQLQDSEGEVLMLEQKLHDGEQALESLRGRLRNSERFGQEYVERCNYLQQTVREKAREIEQFEELIRTMRRENEELQTQLRREGDSREASNSVMPHARRLTHREVRQAYMHVQHFIETEARGQPAVRDPTVQEPPPELVMRHANDEVWLVPVPQVAQPDQEEEEEGSELERATTSSGEYTIRERSSDSSGGYAPELGTGSPAPRGGNPASSASGGGASMLFSAAIHAASVSSVDSTAGKEQACYEPVDDFASCKGEVWWWFLVGCLFGILIGATVIWISQCCLRFIYYNERYVEGFVRWDIGGMLRDGIKTMARVGVCPEKVWTYENIGEKFKQEPEWFCYELAKKCKIVGYARVAQELTQMKMCIANGYPFVFGFSVFPSFQTKEVASTGKMVMPLPDEEERGGHAVCAVGYDDFQDCLGTYRKQGISMLFDGEHLQKAAKTNRSAQEWARKRVAMRKAMCSYACGVTSNALVRLHAQPFSEPETQAFKKICEENVFKTAMNFHAYGSMLTHPFNWATQDLMPAEDKKVYQEIARVFGYKKFGPAIKTVGYTTSGESDDWMYSARHIISMSPEVGPESGGFWPPSSQIDGIDTRNFDRALYVVGKAGMELGTEWVQQPLPPSGTDLSALAGGPPHHLLQLRITNRGLTGSHGKVLRIAVRGAVSEGAAAGDAVGLLVSKGAEDLDETREMLTAEHGILAWKANAIPSRSFQEFRMYIARSREPEGQRRLQTCVAEASGTSACQCTELVEIPGSTQIAKQSSRQMYALPAGRDASGDSMSLLCAAASTPGVVDSNSKQASPAACPISCAVQLTVQFARMS